MAERDVYMRDWFMKEAEDNSSLKRHNRDFLALQGRVGDGHQNNEDDVGDVDSLLSILGFRPKEKQNEPDHFISRDLDTAIKKFQKDNDLKKDGWLAPGGETELALNDKLTEQRTLERKQMPSIEQTSPILMDGIPKPLIKGRRDEDIKNVIRSHEKSVDYIYKDIIGNLTVGAGYLIPDTNHAKELPLYIQDKTGRERLATPAEIQDAIIRIQRRPHGQKFGANEFDPNNQPDLLPIHIKDRDIDVLLDKKLRDHREMLGHKFPELESYPMSVQEGFLDMDFNMGGKFNPQSWPKFYDRVQNRDWLGAAAQSNRYQLSKERNEATKELFERAAKQR